MARIDARMNEVRKGQAIRNKPGRSDASTTARKIRGPRFDIQDGTPSWKLLVSPIRIGNFESSPNVQSETEDTCIHEYGKWWRREDSTDYRLMCGVSVACIAQTPVVLDVSDKVRFHAETTFGPASIAISSVKAGYLQMADSPTEWGQGGDGYSRRLGSSVASSGIRAALAFGLDSTLHQDPRYV